jgi:molybdopterin synthase catalytic subunit
MAEANIRTIAENARARWPLARIAVAHRCGKLELGESAVAVAVSSAHRAEAFEAAKWIMDTIKEQTPIWKREHWADGGADWVHPTKPSGGCT